MPDPDVVRLDPADHHPELRAVRAGLDARDWPAVRKTVDEVSPSGRSLLIRSGCETAGIEDFLRDVVRGDPADGAAAAMLAMHLTHVGWSIRSFARAAQVSQQQFADFHDWLRKAEVVLLDAIARVPDDPALWVARLTTARGLQLGLAETRRRYDKLAAIDPHHLPGQQSLLQQLCPKWSGTWELLHPWCREAMLAAPAGALQGGLVVDGHIEHWLELGDDGPRYLAGEPVRAELYEAANRSIWHADFRPDYGWVDVASSFAMVFVLLDDRRAAAMTFDLLGDLAAERPWWYLHRDVAAAVRRDRAWARSRGGAR